MTEKIGNLLGKEKHEDISIKGNMGLRILEFKGFIWGGIIKRNLWENFRFPIGFWYEDAITRIVLMRKCQQFEYINEDLYYYNIHQNNASKKIWSKQSVKSLDQFFLIKKLVEFDRSIGIEDDNALFQILLYEFGPVLYYRTRKLPQKLRKSIFVMAKKLLESIKTDSFVEYNKDFKLLKNAYDRNDYNLWKLISIYMMLNVKIKNIG